MTELYVYMDGALCGLLEQDGKGDLRFRYDEEYRNQSEATPLSLSMPLQRIEHRKRVVLPFLDGLLPDSEQARTAMARHFGVNPRNPFAMLQFCGADVAGALQILRPEIAASDSSGTYESLHPLSDTEVSDVLSAVVEEYRTGRPIYVQAGRFSLAGAQPKLALCRINDGSWAAPLGSTPTTHILKPQTGDFDRIDVVEHMTMRAASVLEIPVARTWLESIGDWSVIVVERYDRIRVNDSWRRLHQEDFGQALGVSPSKKYQHMDGGPGVGEVARLLRNLPRPLDRQEVAWRFFQGLVFNTIFRCTDAHIKNYSLLLQGSHVSIAPLYDLATVIPYDPHSGSANAAMKIGEHYQFNAITEADFEATARTLGIDRAQGVDFVAMLRMRAQEAWQMAYTQTVQTAPSTRVVASWVLDSVSRILRDHGIGAA